MLNDSPEHGASTFAFSRCSAPWFSAQSLQRRDARGPDSAGRRVEVPAKIERIFAAEPLRESLFTRLRPRS